MPQNYKAVYFADYPAEDSKQKSLTLAFGNKANKIFESIKDLTSEEIRQLLGTDNYRSIAEAAVIEDLPLNRYCVRQLKKSLNLFEEKKGQLTFSDIANDDIFDPVSVTFKGGAKEPFVNWYPYLQGYSPQFVETILKKFSPCAKNILDPFGGTGTTAFTAAKLGIQAHFCEINPVLQFICLTKIRVRRLKKNDRIRLSEKLIQREERLTCIKILGPDKRLEESYKKCFGNSKFFDEDVYEQVLKLRSWIDEISLEDPLLADLLTVAVLATLVPASRMMRVGDMRYKTSAEVLEKTVPILKGVAEKIVQIANDIREDVNGLIKQPIMISEDALSLGKIPFLNIDTVITSPPYVNGTNYFRNTKIELWFLRCLGTNDDLARYRKKAITAGINDVTLGKTRLSKNPQVQQIVKMLEENAYDSRIPRMIGSYFGEIEDVFSFIRHHLTNKAIVAIDIGDSCYGGVHVPVDKLLTACLQTQGFEDIDVTELRKRRSKGGSILKQALLVYRYRGIDNRFYIDDVGSWKKDWMQFKDQLPHQQNPYAKRNWGHPLHSLCSYLGKMKPAIAHHLVKIFVPENGRLLDPFAGVGTIPFEGALQGKTSYGFEISQAAFVIANGKIQFHNRGKCDEIIANLKEYLLSNKPTAKELEYANAFGFNGKIFEYYNPDTLNEVLLARRYFVDKPAQTPEEFFVLSSLLHILHGNRPYALSRRSHPITPYKPTGPAEYRSLIQHLREKVERGLEEQLSPGFKPGKIIFQDATSWWPQEIDELDAIITSPPFFDSTRFYLANWLRLWFCGWNPEDFEGRLLGFVEERQKKNFDVYVPVLRQARERLKRNGVLVMHLGKSEKCNMSEKLLELGKMWFRNSEIFEESVSHCESHGIRDKGTVSSHQYLVMY